MYEWCNFMKLKRTGKAESNILNLVTSIGECQLTRDEKKWLETYYLGTYPEYIDIISKHKSINKRLKHQKTDVNCTLPTQPLLPYEEILLCGPSNTVTQLRRTQVQNKSTGCLLTYCSMLHEENSSRVCSSYVCLNHNQQQECKYPQFGYLSKILFHRFGEKTVTFAKVIKFSKAKFHSELGMWCTPLAPTNQPY